MKTSQNLFLVVCITFFVLFHEVAYSQSINVSNVHWRIIGKKIEIFYDLPRNKDSIEVKLVYLKESDSKFRYSPQAIRGKVGKGIYSGKGQKITWLINNEPTYLFTGDGFKFKVIVRKIPIRIEVIPDM
jgi:hypothetical protein